MQVDPQQYLVPFLEVIRSVDTSGPITGMALSSVFKLVSLGVLHPGVARANDALHLLVDAVTHCRFEATDPASDEVVLMKILQVRLPALMGPRPKYF